MSVSILKKIKAVSIGAAMADMALLLLIFFMATTSTEPPKGVEVELPVASTQGADQDSIYITLANDGKIYYDGLPTSLDELKVRLNNRAFDKDNVVALTADQNLDYETVNAVLDALRELEFLNIVFMAQQKDLSAGGTVP